MVFSQDYQRTWKMAPLRWYDFTVVKDSTLADHSYLEFVLDASMDYKEQEGATVLVPTAVAYMVKELSWVEESHRTDLELRYNQVIFDLVEVARRSLQRRLDSLSTPDSVEYVVQQTMVRLLQISDRFSRLSAYGSKADTVAAWERYVASQLATPVVDSVSCKAVFEFVDSPFRYGFTFGGGFMGIGGGLHNHFSNGGGVACSFDMGLQRHYLTLAFGVNFATCRDSAFNATNPVNDLYTGDALSALDLYAAYGFSVVDNSKMRLTPFIGYGLLGFYFTPNEEDAISMGSSNGCLHFGIDYQRHFSNTYDGYQHDVLSLYAKLFATYNEFSSIIGTPTGYSINLQVGVSLMGRKYKQIRIKR